jgi:DNA-binding transcriptional LysR family regulator
MQSGGDLHVLSQVVECGSFAAAAKQLGVTRSAVCRRIDGLERRLGVRLINRTTRRLSLTEAGETFHQRALRILNEIAEAELIVSEYGGEPRGTLRITSPIMIGLHRLIPILPEFLGRYPQIRAQLDLSDDEIDPALADHDVGLRWGAPKDSAAIITKVAESRQIICAAPGYLDRHGTPEVPQDLLQHNCMLMSRLGLTYNEWSFMVDGRVTKLKVQGNYVVNGGHGNYEAVRSGLGIGRVTDLRVTEDIRNGSLRPILQRFEPPNAVPIYAAYKAGPLVPPKIRIFLDFLRRRMRA